MKRFLVAANKVEEYAALRSLLLSLGLDLHVVGEAHSLQDTIEIAANTQPGIVVVDWNLFERPEVAPLDAIRSVCPTTTVIVLLSPLNARQHAMTLSGSDVFISKGENATTVVERLRAVALTNNK